MSICVVELTVTAGCPLYNCDFAIKTALVIVTRKLLEYINITVCVIVSTLVKIKEGTSSPDILYSQCRAHQPWNAPWGPLQCTVWKAQINMKPWWAHTHVHKESVAARSHVCVCVHQTWVKQLQYRRPFLSFYKSWLVFKIISKILQEISIFQNKSHDQPLIGRTITNEWLSILAGVKIFLSSTLRSILCMWASNMTAMTRRSAATLCHFNNICILIFVPWLPFHF